MQIPPTPFKLKTKLQAKKHFSSADRFQSCSFRDPSVCNSPGSLQCQSLQKEGNNWAGKNASVWEHTNTEMFEKGEQCMRK